MADTKRFTPFLRQCFVTTAVCCSVVGQGCLIGFPGVLLPQLQGPDSAISLNEDQASWIAAVSSISMLSGYFLVPPVMGRAGRKAAHYSVIMVMLLGWLTMALATNYEGLIAGKILQGLAYGMFMPLRSVIIGEYTSPRYRGGFITIISVAKTFGVLFVHLIGSVSNYKITALVSMAFSITSLLMTMYSPESPSWLATQGSHEECKKAFIWLREIEETSELEGMIKASKHLQKQTRKQNKMKDVGAVMKKKEFYKPIVLMFALNILWSFSGSTLMGSYAVAILNLLMGPDVQAHLWMVALDAQSFFFSFVAIYVINRVRRRTMIFSTGAVCVGSLLAMAAYAFIKTKSLLAYDLVWIPGILINLQLFSVAIGIAPLTNVLAGEVFPLQHRGLGGSISLIACSGSMFFILKTFSGLASLMGIPGTFVLYSVVMVGCLCVAWVLLPETSGRTLQQIEEHFRGAPLPDPEAGDMQTAPLKRSDE